MKAIKTDNSNNLQKAKTVTMASVKYPCRAELKLDGVRVLLLDGRFYSRSGIEINLPDTKRNLITSFNPIGTMMDLEVTVNEGKMKDRSIVSGLINSAMKGGTIDEFVLKFNIIDTMPSDAYRNKHCVSNYKERLHSIDILHDQVRGANFHKIPHVDVRTQKDLENYYNAVLGSGFEGLVAKHYEDMYQFKRSSQWARFKKFKTADLECLGSLAGKGKYERMIGSLTLTGMVEGQTVYVNAGSGMTDDDRSMGPDYYTGKTIEVRYSMVTKDKDTGLPSLNQPTFVCVRDDKS